MERMIAIGTRQRARGSFVLAFMLASLSIAPQVFGQTPPSLIPTEPGGGRWFLGGLAGGLSFRGDLDGKLVLGDATKVFFIPSPERGTGLGLSVGRLEKKGLWSVSFFRSPHRVSFRGGTSASTFNAVLIDGRAYFLPRSPATPYIHVGIVLPWLAVRNGSTLNGAPRDATYLGLGVTGGAGLLVKISRYAYVSAGYLARWLAFLYAKGEGSKGRDVQNLYVDQTGPRRHGFLSAWASGWEVSFGFRL